MHHIGEQEPPARLRTTPSWLLTQTAAHASRLVGDSFAGVGARGYHYRVLATLDEFGPASQADLGRRGGIDRSDVVATVNELTARDLVVRAPDPTDRRRNVITLTAAGRTELHRMGQALAEVQETLLAPLTSTEREQLTRLLGKLLDHHTRPRR
ncbi:MarR family winged helix-turn-helix transcriptional regulator [Micromonospora peucetia]|uniref:DNA-binding transcriptional regulator, MarR family n=1 Tax=Micromonospora peucetia TaxID=47871 RepID=A0A1C6W1Y7_9ACTN|nr:MarR family winged helix-turn-helix transcriptional regulator [Micromonospora peucetia]WSA32002.1 MarR family winged helix-turn-helix transcriptional regulator [Micromonospora peucetia]SCL72548.1 DNA-binding transcriptional regulator, MarR family [Micromonospora peucetia]